MSLLEKYSKIIEKIITLDGVFAVYLFGSYAKGKVSKKSDLDLCFFVDSKNSNLIKEIISYGNDELDISIFSDLPLSIKFDILKNGKVLKINNKEDFKEMKLKALRRYKDESWVFRNIYFKRYGVKI